ncbi:MAG: HAD family hydrolase [Beduini sp.]|uniref:HAD family hydrolase n=1 Tax=Beduini sp. TaxID=1922300 RepID=UPI0039A0A4DD
MLKAVIFDMDGLMIDSERVTFDGYVIECNKLGHTMTKEFYKTLLGKPITGIYDQFHKEFGEDFPIEEVIQKVHAYMADLFETKGVPVKPGLIELLKYLKENNYKTIVATSSNRHRVDVILENAKIASYFDDSICGDEVSKGKPNPEVFLKSCEKLGVSPDEALVLEDSEAGILAAYSADIRVICIPDMKYPEKEYAEMTHDIVDNLNDVLTLIKDQQL